MTTIELKIPDIGNNSEVEIIEILVKLEDNIQKDQSVLTLETDKATMEIPAADAGILKSLNVAVGDKVSAGQVIGTLQLSATSIAPDFVAEPVVPQKAIAPALPVENKLDAVSLNKQAFVDAYASPSIRKLARELNIDLALISGTGRKGRITEEDVRSFNTPKSAVVSAGIATNALGLLPWPQVDFSKFGTIESRPLSKIKKISGANLSRNWAMIPHVTQFDEADITEMESFRVSMSVELKDQGIKLTPLAFLVKAVVKALQAFPEFNSSLDGDNLILKQYYHIGFAADTPQGLVVPVIKDADQKSLIQIATESAQLAAKAREGKLSPLDMQGGCFSISSLGGIGGTAFTPIINAPEVAILGVSKSQTKPIWDGSNFQPRLMLPLSLSYDHRVIDGASAAKFTVYLAKVLGDIRRLML